MAFDAFLEINGPDVKGESTAAGMEGKFEIYSFSWGGSNPTTVGSGATGMSGGKVSLSSLNIMKKTEKSSANLFSKMCTGTSYEKATLYLRKAGGEGGQQLFLKYVMEGVFVESMQWSGSSGGDDRPTESVSLAFGKVTMDYLKQDPKKGTTATETTASYDLTKVTK